MKLLIGTCGLLLTLALLYLLRQNNEYRETVVALREECTKLRLSLEDMRRFPARPAHDDLIVQTGSRDDAASEEEIPYENALEQWLVKVKRLTGYLKTRPDLRIPQMARLTAEDWLDVTKDKPFDCEADFRKALGELRGMARQKEADHIGVALRAAWAANSNNPPENLYAAVLPHLPSTMDPAIAAQLRSNPSGVIGGLKTQRLFVVVDQPVDLWDATLFYAADGSWGARAAVHPAEASIRKALAAFLSHYGVSPHRFEDLHEFMGRDGVDPAEGQELLLALQRKVK